MPLGRARQLLPDAPGWLRIQIPTDRATPPFPPNRFQVFPEWSALINEAADLRPIRLFLGPGSLATTAGPLRIATMVVCGTVTRFDLPP
jgi:hypothetical protein